MRAAPAIVALLFLAGCGTAPEPQIITKTVNVAVPTPCKPVLPARPALLNKDQVKAALAAAPNLDERLKIISGQLLLYMGWVPVIEAGLASCGGNGSGTQ